MTCREEDTFLNHISQGWSVAQGTPEDKTKFAFYLLCHCSDEGCLSDAAQAQNQDQSAAIHENPVFQFNEFTFSSIKIDNLRRFIPLILPRNRVWSDFGSLFLIGVHPGA